MTYRAPYPIPQLPSGDSLPAGEFLLPVCTTRERFLKTLSVLNDYRNLRQDNDLDYVIDIWRAMAHVANPGNSTCLECAEDDGCYHYPAISSFIEYAPQNPVLDPDYTPPGYTKPPFYVFHDQVVNFGAVEGDIIVDWTSLTSVTLGQIGLQGLPRFRVPFVGVGQVELELLKIPQGGIAYITKDGNPVGGKFIDMATIGISEVVTVLEAVLDLVFDGTYIDTEVIEIDFDTPGEHYVDVTFLPMIDADTWIGFGGGIRSVRICGADILPEASGMIRAKPSQCLIIQQFVAGEWVDAIDLNPCIDVIQGPPGPQGIQGLPGIPGTNGTNGTNGAAVEMRVSGGWIQWKLTTSSTWINLISVASITGPQGIQGIQGVKGDTGAVGPQGVAGPGGNVYQPVPTANTPNSLCNSATYIASKIRELIVKVYDDLEEFTPSEVLESLLGLLGWRQGPLYQLIGLLDTNDKTALLAAYDAALDDLICALINGQLSQTTIVAWANTNLASSVVLRDAIIYAIQSAAQDGKYAMWISVGALIDAGGCVDCIDTNCVDFKVGTHGFANPFDSGYVAGSGYGRTLWNNGRIVVAKNLLNSTKPIIRVKVVFNKPHNGWVSVRNFAGVDAPRTTLNSAVFDIMNISVLNGINIDIGKTAAPFELPTDLFVTNVCIYYQA